MNAADVRAEIERSIAWYERQGRRPEVLEVDAALRAALFCMERLWIAPTIEGGEIRTQLAYDDLAVRFVDRPGVLRVLPADWQGEAQGMARAAR